MTRDQAVAAVGSGAILKEEKTAGVGEVLLLSTAPKTCKCDTYFLGFSSAHGLLKISVSTTTVPVNDEGDQLKDQFEEIVASLTSKYGKPKILDFTQSDDTEPQFWMLDLKGKERVLLASWNYGKNEGGGTTRTGISVEATAATLNSGYLTISYEFPGWNALADQFQKAANSVY